MSSTDSRTDRLTKPEELNRDHDVSGFCCGRESLDDWLKNRALKSNMAGDSRVFVICNRSGEVVGYYAVSAGSVRRHEAVGKIKRNAPDPIPMALIGRLAVRVDLQGHGVGPALLRDAVLRISQASEHIGLKGVLVHALDKEAARFYARMGFRPSTASDHHLMISLKDIAAELGRGPMA
jgi:predicted N-acetyltransferase YhbS